MSTANFQKRLDRLQSSGDWRNGIADRLDRALVEYRARRNEFRRLGLTKADIEAREEAELRERVEALRQR